MITRFFETPLYEMTMMVSLEEWQQANPSKEATFLSSAAASLINSQRLLLSLLTCIVAC
jgi:hypothetical protein